MVFIEIQPGDVGASELDNLSGRTANTTANIENLHVWLDVDAVCEVVFVAGYGAVEGLAVGKPAEVKALTPPVLVEIRGEVVVSRSSAQPVEGNGEELNTLSGKACVVVRSFLSGAFVLVLGLLVVPMLEILVHSGNVCGVVLLHHGTDSALGIFRLLVEDLVEG